MKKQDLNGVRTPSDLERKYSFSLLKKAIELVENGLTKIQGELYNFVDATTKHFKSVDGKLDGYYSIWFFSGVPSLENAPASEWDDFNIHLDDLYYDTDTGYSYRFILENDEYKWIKLDDDDLSNVLAIASHAQDTADSKRRVFVEEPVPPYDVGDLWITKGQIFACEQSRTVDDAAADPANDFGLTLDYASNGRVDDVQDVTDSIETLFTIDRKNGKIVLNAEKLLQIGSKGKLLIDGGILVVNASNYSLNEEGTVTITGGSIGGFEIGSTKIERKDSEGNILLRLDAGDTPEIRYVSAGGKQWGRFGWHAGVGATSGGLVMTEIDSDGIANKVTLCERFLELTNTTQSGNQMLTRYGIDNIISTSGSGLFKIDGKQISYEGHDHAIKDKFIVSEHSTATLSTDATTTASSATLNIGAPGYYPLGIVGVKLTGTNFMYVNLFNYYLSAQSNGSGTITYRYRNNSTATFSGKIEFRVLWVKTT